MSLVYSCRCLKLALSSHLTIQNIYTYMRPAFSSSLSTKVLKHRIKVSIELQTASDGLYDISW